MCLSIFLASRIFFKRRRRTRWRRIQRTLNGRRALAVPRRLPKPKRDQRKISNEKCGRVTISTQPCNNKRTMRGKWTPGWLAGWCSSIARRVPVNLGPERNCTAAWHKTSRSHPWVYLSNQLEQNKLHTSVSSLALGFIAELNTSPTVHYGRLLHNKTIFVQLLDIAARVRQGNFINLVGIQPDFVLSALQNIGR